MHRRANMRSTNIATEQKQTLHAQRKRCNPDAVSLIVSACCSVSVAILLLVSKRDVNCVVDWLTGIGSNAVFLLLSLIASSVPSLLYLSRRYQHSTNSKELNEIVIELLSLLNGFIVFFVGVLLATGIQKVSLVADVYESFLELPLSYSVYLVRGQYLIFYILVAAQMALAAGIITLVASVLYKSTGNISISLILPVLILKLEDLLTESLLGVNSGLYYNGSFYMLSFASVRFQLTSSVHFVRIVFSVGLIIFCLSISYLSRMLEISKMKRNLAKRVLDIVLIIVPLCILMFCALKGVVRFAKDTNENLSVYFIPHLFDNIHFLTFWSLLYYLIISLDIQNRCSSVLNVFLRNLVKSITAYLLTVLMFIIAAIPNITFGNSWGRIIHTLSYRLPELDYEMIVSANSVIEQSYVPIEATVKSFILVVLVLVMISLLYLVLEIMANHYVAVLIVFVPIQLLSAGELYYRFPWIYYFSPFSWTRLSLNGELVNGFVYPSFGAKVTGLMFLIVVLTVVLTLINKKQNKYD